ncbi:hypothetical protein AAHH71_00135 [Bacillus toyonensis]
MLIDNREKYNSNLDVNIGFIVNAYNYKEMYDLAGILKSIGVHNFRIKTDIASRLNVDDEMIKEIKRDFERIRQDFEDGYFKLVTIHKLEENDKIRTFNKCTINKLVSNVSSDGNVYACNYHPPIDGVRYDNVLKYDFETIWENANKDFDIKELCPKMCDPFKTRANNLLDAITESDDISTGINEALEIYEFEKNESRLFRKFTRKKGDNVIKTYKKDNVETVQKILDFTNYCAEKGFCNFATLKHNNDGTCQIIYKFIEGHIKEVSMLNAKDYITLGDF